MLSSRPLDYQSDAPFTSRHPSMKPTSRAVLPLLAIAMLTPSCMQNAQGYLAKANELYNAGKYDESILQYKKAIQKDQRFGEAYYRLGLAELKKRDTREAFRALLSATTLLRDRPDIKVKLADL